MIQTITYIIAAGGVLLLAVFFQKIRNVDTEQKLKRWRHKEEGFADLLNYAAVVDDGVVVCKSGALVAAWIYKGDDNASSTDEHRAMVSARINQALVGLGSGWMMHIDAVRRPVSNYSARGLSKFPDRITTAIDEERRRLFEGLGTMYEGYFVLSVTWHPPALMQKKFVELMIEDDLETPSKTIRTENLIQQFNNQVDRIESDLSLALKMKRLKAERIPLESGGYQTNDNFLSWLQFCVTGTQQPIVLPKNPIYIDALIGGQEFRGGMIPKIGDKFIQVVAIEGFPTESMPGILSVLAEIPCEYRWSSRTIFLDQHEAIKLFEKYRSKWRQKVRGFFDQMFNTGGGRINEDAAMMVNQAEAAITEISSGIVGSVYFTSCVVIMDVDREQLLHSAKKVEGAIKNLSFATRIETLNTIEAYLGSLPAHGVENIRRPTINTMNAADLIPTSSIWTGSEHNPCPMYPPMSPAVMHCVTHGATPFRLNLHVRDVGHALMFGPTGVGKSTHLAILAAQLRRYEGMTIFAFDKAMSLYALTKAVGGQHFEVASDSDRLSFCPLQFLETKGDRAFAMEWVDAIVRLNGIETTPQQRNAIGTAIMSMYRTGAKTLSELSLTVQNEELREAIKPYTVDGAMGHLLDAETDGLLLSQFTTFEIEELMGLGDKYALPVLLYLFRRIEKSLKGQPAAILLDEAWIMLGHPIFRDKIREWLKDLRKKNCLVLMATQSLTDAANSGIFDVIVESTATKIFLPNIYASDPDTSTLYKRMGLNDRQIQILTEAIPKRQYYCVSEKGRRLYELAAGPLTLAFAGASDKESVAKIKALENRHGDQWVDHWLEERGIELAAYKDYLEL